MGFLLFLIILFIVVRLSWPWISRKIQEKAARMMADRMRRDFERQARQHDGGFGPFSAWFESTYGSARQQAQSEPRPARRKVFTSDVGEYAEFEDLDGQYHATYTESRTTVVEESQVSDAEWEEIN